MALVCKSSIHECFQEPTLQRSFVCHRGYTLYRWLRERKRSVDSEVVTLHRSTNKMWDLPALDSQSTIIFTVAVQSFSVCVLLEVDCGRECLISLVVFSARCWSQFHAMAYVNLPATGVKSGCLRARRGFGGWCFRRRRTSVLAPGWPWLGSWFHLGSEDTAKWAALRFL